MFTEPPPPQKNRVVNKLTMQQGFMVLDWLRQNEADAKTQPDTKLAARASADLSFEITAVNLTSAREAAGIEKIKPAAPPTLEERIQQLELMLSAHQSLLASISQKLFPAETPAPSPAEGS